MNAGVGRAGVLVALVSLLGAATSCTDPAHTSGADTTDIDTFRDSTVAVQVAGCGSRNRRGVGTVIDDSGLVVTAAHVVAGAVDVEVFDADGNGSSSEIVFFDPSQDIAALRPLAVVGPSAALRSVAAQPDDMGIIVVSDDGEATPVRAPSEIVEVEVLRTVTIRTTDIYHDADVERTGFEIDAAVDPGDSGAMVHLVDGGVGIVWARSTVHADRAWAVGLPDVLTDAVSRAALVDTVDPGPCP